MHHKAPYRIHQVTGHQGKITCLYLPTKSCLLFSGGEDRVVNVWKIGSPTRICEFTGNQSTIECLASDPIGKVVYAGSQGGSIRSFSVEGIKAIRKYSGHLSSCTCVDVSAVQEILASGSMDTNVKIWDRRTKSAIATSKSHQAEITCVKFCPSEHQLLSGDKDGAMMIWDLRKTRNAVLEFVGHSADILDVAFDPVDAFFVSSSKDKTLKSWDLDETHFESSTSVDANVTKCLNFLDDSGTVAGVTQEGVKIYLTEPSLKISRSIDVNWNSVAHSILSPDAKEIVCGGFYGSFITVFAVPLHEAVDRSIEKKKYMQVKDPPKTPNVIHGGLSTDTMKHFPDGGLHVGTDIDPVKLHYSNIHERPKTGSNERPRTGWERQEDIVQDIDIWTGMKKNVIELGGNHCTVGTGMTNTLEKLSLSGIEEMDASLNNRDEVSPPEYSTGNYSHKVYSEEKTAKKRFQVHTINDMNSPAVVDGDKYVAPSKSNKQVPSGINFEHFVKETPSVDENSILAEISSGGVTFSTSLTNRLGHLKVISSFWQEENPLGAIMHIQQYARPARDTIVVDFLNSIDFKKLDLDCCILLLPLTTSLFRSDFKSHIETSIKAGSLLLRTFSPIITSTRQYAQNNREVDINREERLKKCDTCHRYFKEMMSELQSLESSRLLKSISGDCNNLLGLLIDFFSS